MATTKVLISEADIRQRILALAAEIERDYRRDEGIHLVVGAKEPGQAMNLAPVDLSFSYREALPDANIADAYERLLLDAIRGDASLFTRGDEVQASWALLTPILEAWRESGRDVQPYFTNTWGPERAEGFLGEGRTWREP